MKKSVLILIGAAALLTACTNGTYGDKGGAYSGKGDVCPKTPPTAIEFAAQRATPAEIATCEAAGGAVSPQGLAGFDMCVLPYCDAGQVCTDSADCVGKCYTEAGFSGSTGDPATGVCQANSSPFGCRTEVVGGAADATLCVD